MHQFSGKWITNDEFCNLPPRNVFHKQLEKVDLPCDEHRNRHILFRKKFELKKDFKSAKIYISADDYYKLYINGKFVTSGPTMSYHFQYNYNTVDVTEFLKQGENTIAVHTLYQGIINRVWQSGDNRHGLIFDLETDGEITVKSDETFKVCAHSGYKELFVTGINTQFMEEYDSRCKEVGFKEIDFDDSGWQNAEFSKFDDHILVEQKTKMLEFETIKPDIVEKRGNKIFIDFAKTYAGYLNLTANGKSGDVVTVRCAQELNDDGSVRYEMRCNCKYEETWILRDGESVLDWFDYKAFRYVELILPETATVTDISLTARHYPFSLKATLKKEYRGNEKSEKIWELCVNTQKYGVQEAIYDCMDREKGFYLGDGCYSALTNYILTGNDDMVRKLIDDAFSSSFITDGLVTCLNCSHMQEIAEFPLILIDLLLWHYSLSGDMQYLRKNYFKAVKILEGYKKDYEHGFLLSEVDKWCVVEWPANYQDGYDVEIREGIVCKQAHVSLNAYYLNAVNTVNEIAKILGEDEYRNIEPLKKAFIKAFYSKEEKLFRDGVETSHISMVGNIFPFAFDLCPNEECEQKILDMLIDKKISYVSFFCAFPAMAKAVKLGRYDVLKECLLDENAWLKMLREGATTIFEGWGKDSKKNLSLFHLTFTYAALFMADIDLEKLFLI